MIRVDGGFCFHEVLVMMFMKLLVGTCMVSVDAPKDTYDKQNNVRHSAQKWTY